MARLIYAKALTKRTDRYAPYISDTVRKELRYVPTVDAVEVVRCKDCRKYIPCQKLPIGTSKWCGLFDRATCEMKYCGWGERREDADD